MVMARMRSGFAVIGDTQHLPGYCVLLCQDAGVDHLTDLGWRERTEFLFDLSLLGEAVEAACRDDALRRINYEVLGNALPLLHGHVHARYEWERLAEHPVWRYGEERWAAEHEYDDELHGELRKRVTAELERLMAAAY
jgi:diadenosine tetraphosphate (Ap4A) HIT family hydrolase